MSAEVSVRNDGGMGCLVFVIVIWLLFYGGCAKMEKLIDSQIEKNERQIQQTAPAENPSTQTGGS